MKKSLTVIPLIMMSVFMCTACGDKTNNNSDFGSYYEDHDYGNGNSDRYDNDDRNNDISDDFSDIGDGVKDTVDGVIDGVEDAGEAIVSDADSAVDDMTEDNTTTHTTE